MVKIQKLNAVNADIQAKGSIPVGEISNCLWGDFGQLEQLEKLVKFEVKVKK